MFLNKKNTKNSNGNNIIQEKEKDMQKNSMNTKGKNSLSILAEGTSINGDITTSGDLQVDGKMVGNLHVQSLTIGENGDIQGNIFAENLQINGTVNGEIWAKNIHLHSGASVRGNVYHTALIIESGGMVNGGYYYKEADKISEKLNEVAGASNDKTNNVSPLVKKTASSGTGATPSPTPEKV
jgi:cytoskeletal protein CcmA (bactofilin family)